MLLLLLWPLLAAVGLSYLFDEDRPRFVLEAVPDPGTLYHRVGSTQTVEIARRQQATGEVWGTAARYSSAPRVRAYRGPLPDGAPPGAVEFATDVAPDDPHAPIATWSGPRAGVTLLEVDGVEYAQLSCRVTRIVEEAAT